MSLICGLYFFRTLHHMTHNVWVTSRNVYITHPPSWVIILRTVYNPYSTSCIIYIITVVPYKVYYGWQWKQHCPIVDGSKYFRFEVVKVDGLSCESIRSSSLLIISEWYDVQCGNYMVLKLTYYNWVIWIIWYDADSGNNIVT